MPSAGPSTASVLTIRQVPLDRLHADPHNARTHPQRNLDALAASLAQWGQVEPIVVQKGTGRVIGGNARLEVLRNMGRTEAAVVELDVDDVNATALAIALNRTAELANWDGRVLLAQLEALRDADGLDRAAVGFDDDELAQLARSLRFDPDDLVGSFSDGISAVAGGRQITFVFSHDDADVADAAIGKRGKDAVAALLVEACKEVVDATLR